MLRGEYDSLHVTAKYYILHRTYSKRKLHHAVMGLGEMIVAGYVGKLGDKEHYVTKISNATKGSCSDVK